MALLDLTELGDAATDAHVRTLCDKARGTSVLPPVAAVCVWPCHVALAKTLLPGAIRVATVINFPSGDGSLPDMQAEALDAVAQGADEIDLVIPYKALLAGDEAAVAAMVRQIAGSIGPRALKTILETGIYPDGETVRRASDLCIANGARFIKTSTGKRPQGATLEAARIMLTAIRAAPHRIGLKPSGGIRSLADANAYLALADDIMGAGWATPETFRFGASGLWDALAATLEGRNAEAASSRY